MTFSYVHVRSQCRLRNLRSFVDVVDTRAPGIGNSINYSRNNLCLDMLNYKLNYSLVLVTCKQVSIICAYCTC